MHLLVTLLILSQGAQSMVKDAYENLLPPGAIARFGTQRFRAGFPVNSLAVNHDGKTLACTNRKGTLFLFNAVTGEAKHVIRQDFLDHVAFSPNGKLLVCSGRVGIRLLEPGSGAIMREIAVEEKGMDTACLSPNGEMIAAEFSPDRETAAKDCGQRWRERGFFS